MSDYNRLREAAGQRNLSARAQFRLEGRDRTRLLHNLTTNDIRQLKPGEGCYATIVQRTGKLVAELQVRCHADYLVLEAPAALRETLREFIEKHAIMDEVKLVETPGPLYGVYGPDASKLLNAPELPLFHFVERDGRRIARIPFGFETNQSAAEPVSDEAWEAFRIECGIPEWGKELDESVIPVEAGLEPIAISYTKGCYIGQEVIQRIKTYSEAKQALRGLLLNRLLPPGPLHKDGREAGRITSPINSIALKRPVALGYVRKEWKEAGTLLDEGTVADLPLYPV